jgi:hypothetical protein
LPAPQEASASQTQTPEAQAGVAPEQAAQPAGDEAVPQRCASVAEHEAHAPLEQKLPGPHEASEAQTQTPAEQVGVSPTQTAHPAGDASVPQEAASVAEQGTHAPLEQ